MKDQTERDELAQLHSTMDADVWASEFMRMQTRRKAEGKTIEVDHSLMLAWFANAIMTGYDHANLRRDRVETEPTLGDPPGSHWIYDRAAQEQLETLVSLPSHSLPITALRYALRAATSFGKTDRIDPDAVEQAFVRILLGKNEAGLRAQRRKDSGLPDDPGGPED